MTAIISLFAWAFSDLSCFAIFVLDILILKYFFEIAVTAMVRFRATPYYRLLRIRSRLLSKKDYRFNGR